MVKPPVRVAPIDSWSRVKWTEINLLCCKHEQSPTVQHRGTLCICSLAGSFQEVSWKWGCGGGGRIGVSPQYPQERQSPPPIVKGVPRTNKASGTYAMTDTPTRRDLSWQRRWGNTSEFTSQSASRDGFKENSEQKKQKLPTPTKLANHDSGRSVRPKHPFLCNLSLLQNILNLNHRTDPVIRATCTVDLRHCGTPEKYSASPNSAIFNRDQSWNNRPI